MKQLLIVTLTIALIFALATCNDDKGDDTSPCTCLSTYGTTAHLGMNETCTCGGTDCTACTEQKTTIEGTTIPIRKEAGVTVQQMNDAVTNINNMYSWLSTIEQGKLATKITVIHIVTGSGVIQKGTVLEVGFDADDESIADYVIVNVVA
jgi:hypothetical protein